MLRKYTLVHRCKREGKIHAAHGHTNQRQGNFEGRGGERKGQRDVWHVAYRKGLPLSSTVGSAASASPVAPAAVDDESFGGIASLSDDGVLLPFIR